MSAFLPSGLPRAGVRFVPTDEELVCHYLQRKINGESSGDLIQDIDLYSREPWLLPHKSHPLFEEHEWFYFVKLVQLSSKSGGNRPKRTIDGDLSGSYWRTTVGDRPVLSATGHVVGLKKCLTFYTGKNGSNKAGVTSDWTMIEYRLNSQSFQDQVVCRIRHNVKRTHSGAASSSTQEPSSPTDSLAASSSTPEDQSSPAELDISVSAPPFTSAVDASVGLDVSGLSYVSAPMELEQSVATTEENWCQGYMPMLTTEGSVSLEFVDDETFLSEALELPWIQDRSLGSRACPMALLNGSDFLGYAPWQSSFTYGVGNAVMDATVLHDAESMQKDTYLEETHGAEYGNLLQDLSIILRTEGSDLLEFADDEIYMIEAPDVPWMEDQKSLGVCAMDVTPYADATESVQKDANFKEATVLEEEKWLENLAAMIRAEDNIAPNVPWVVDSSFGTAWC